METMTSVLTPLGFTTEHVSTLSDVLGWVKQGSTLVRNECWLYLRSSTATVLVRCRCATASHPLVLHCECRSMLGLLRVEQVWMVKATARPI
jgi:hypothetical protein